MRYSEVIDQILLFGASVALRFGQRLGARGGAALSFGASLTHQTGLRPHPNESGSDPVRSNIMANASTDGYYEALWPRSPRQVQLQPLARRLDTLEGKTIAQMWDYVFRGDEVFALLEEGLKERYPNIKWVSYKEIGNTHGGDEREVVASIARRFKELKVDAAISGMGC
jgi:hypothetical protein